MVNVLSLRVGSTVSGKDINDWICDQIRHERAHKKDAQNFIDHFIIRDEQNYHIVKMLLGKTETIGFQIT